MKSSISIYLVIVMLLLSCKNETKKEISRSGKPPLEAMIHLDKGAYEAGDEVKAQISLVNNCDKSVKIEALELRFINISDGTGELRKELNTVDADWESMERVILNVDIKIPRHFNKGAYGVYLIQKEKGYEKDEVYQSFFRVIEKSEIVVYNIETENVSDASVFKLDGGMSAEYIVEKSAENLTSGISHSWKVNAPGSGPNHVLSTSNYLEKSVRKTVDFYNEIFGENTEIETVIVSTGFPSIPYISNALKAPVLPLHYLVSVNTVKEVKTILSTANNNKLSSYATLSHDPSVPYAVAWIKLLKLPLAYKNFIKQHKIKNVVIMGATGISEGETKARQLLFDDKPIDEYADGSIYIMYPGTSPDDVKTLQEKIVDLKDFKQEDEFVRIADWESGINQKQISNFSNDAKNVDPSVKVSTITAEDLGRLYALGGYSSLALMHKNKDKFDRVKGVIFNPYLISHPTIELKKGFVPLLYWQLVGANYTVYNMENDLFKAIKHFYPNTSFKDLKLWLNSTRNFGAKWSAVNLKKELTKKRYTNFIENNYEVDEVWDLSNGVDAPCELLYLEVKNSYGFKNLKSWNDSLELLTIDDIKELSNIFGGFQVETK